MEEFGIATIVIVLVIVWYLGSSINAVLAGSGKVCEKEFKGFEQQQDIRLLKNRVKLHKQVEKLKDAKVYSDAEWSKIFDPEDAE